MNHPWWKKIRSWLPALAGLLIVAAYWWVTRTEGSGRGYFEDYCYDLSRRAMAKNLLEFGKPTFTSDLFMAPFGTPIAFFSWSIERDWLGAYVWMWNKDFPFLLAYFIASLLGSYIVVGWILRRMKLSPLAAWGVAAAVVTFHVPRHFQTWYHIEYLTQHWIYWSLFLDAWIWYRWTRERRWSLSLELWRGVCLIGVLGAPGYFWGPMVLEWLFLRAFLLPSLFGALRKNEVKPEVSWRAMIAPALLIGLYVVIALRWFPPLLAEMKKLGPVENGIGFYANLGYVFRPLWLDQLLLALRQGLSLAVPALPRIDKPETVVTIGWFYWLPLLLGLWALRRRAGGAGLRVVAPFLAFLVFGILYFAIGPTFLHDVTILLVPFMSFFRVTCRWGEFLPQMTAVVIALSWPELSAWVRARLISGRRVWLARGALGLFAVMSVVEFGWLSLPPMMLAPLPQSTEAFLEDLRKAPGTTVLDMPFCLAGGNGVCTARTCPNYPASTVGACFSGWHEKKVFGVYFARLTEPQCEPYLQQPYASWLNAWSTQRCFTDDEWAGLCRYLDEHGEISAILVYPDIWRGFSNAECARKAADNLGLPIAQRSFQSRPSRGGEGAAPMSVLRFAGKCVPGARR